MVVAFFLNKLHNAPIVELSANYLRYDPLNGMVVLNSAIKFPVGDLIDVQITTGKKLGEKRV